MSFTSKLKKELRSVGVSMLYFLCWISLLVFIKQLLLDEYEIKFYGMSKVLFGAFIAAKAIRLLDGVPFGPWVRRQPAIIEILLRTSLYGLGVALLLLLDTAFERRAEFGGFGSAIQGVVTHIDLRHIWVNTICIWCAFFGWNVLSLLRQYLRPFGFLRILFSPAPNETKES